MRSIRRYDGDEVGGVRVLFSSSPRKGNGEEGERMRASKRAVALVIGRVFVLGFVSACDFVEGSFVFLGEAETEKDVQWLCSSCWILGCQCV